ncbi:PAS domain-containing protein [Rhodovibrionaceae bacterium A322]
MPLPVRHLNLEDLDVFLEGSSPEIRQLVDYWLSLRNGALLPKKSDFDPIAVPNLLKSIWIYEYRAAEDRFTCRLAGQSVNTAWGEKSLAGQDLRVLASEEAYPVMHERWSHVINRPALMYSRRQESGGAGLFAAIERLITPLSDDQGNPVFVIGVSLYSNALRPNQEAELESNLFSFLNLRPEEGD